ncbi:hypothetical protein HS088_TW09G00797 [Tripterygium wilfordii]|uniref:Myb/SANT-like domain-containing protein n=1 Tax=Tripterygium wilfordii TaxID=458696 RepID=A0A7J7D8R5_TRIWF|nr:uncharacterized protein LOC120005134 [Tripterygium wilfordii]KAF5742737.1 hypothetical protein HS088_TW09G00797 [Tripterygium wilfordii]
MTLHLCLHLNFVVHHCSPVELRVRPSLVHNTTRKGKGIVVDADFDLIKWDIVNTKMFLDMLSKWKKKNMGMLKWDKIADEFKKVSGYTCTAQKLKSKHDNLKQNWQLFNRLMTVETGLGFNFETGKVEATDDWWTARIQENPNVKKFCNNGLPLRQEQAKLWGGNTATGDDCISPAIANESGCGSTFDDDCYTPQPVQADLENIPEEISTGTSPVKARTPYQHSTSIGKGRKRKKVVEEINDLNLKNCV